MVLESGKMESGLEKSIYWRIFFGLFSKFCDKETCRECLGDALRKV